MACFNVFSFSVLSLCVFRRMVVKMQKHTAVGKISANRTINVKSLNWDFDARREKFLLFLFFCYIFFPSFSVALPLTIQFLISRSVIHKFDIIRIEMLKTVKRGDLRKKSHNFKILFIRCLCPAVVRRVNKKSLIQYWYLLCKTIDKQRI